MKIGPSLVVGLHEAEPVRLLEREGFQCAELPREQWTHRNAAVVRAVRCSARAKAEPGGYRVVYVSLGLDLNGRLAEVGSGSYGGGTYPASRQRR